jgi:hypothetical protein
LFRRHECGKYFCYEWDYVFGKGSAWEYIRHGYYC